MNSFVKKKMVEALIGEVYVLFVPYKSFGVKKIIEVYRRLVIFCRKTRQVLSWLGEV